MSGKERNRSAMSTMELVGQTPFQEPIVRLNGWQRIGVVSSICWFLVGGFWINGMVIHELGAPAVGEYRRCLDARSIQPDGTIPKDTDWGPCTKRFQPAFEKATENHWVYALAYTVIPIPIAWLIIYGLVVLVRWIGAGFVQKPKSN